MDFDKMTLFGAMKKRVAWLTQRQEVISQNIANSDSPGYLAKDLQAFGFKKALSQKMGQITMVRTRSDHLSGQVRSVRDFRVGAEKKPYETSPSDNSVILEEQMMKLGETGINHRLTTEIYRKHLNMFRTALGKDR